MPEQMIAEKRTLKGKGPNRRLRNSGKIPAVLYGKGVEALSLAIDPVVLKQVLSSSLGMNAVLEIDVQDEGKSAEKRTAMIRDFQIHPLKHTYMHADFIGVDVTQMVRVRVPIEVTGKALGVIEGGIIQVVRRDIGISCLPSQIPSQIEVDVTELNIGDSIHVGDVVLGEGMTTADEDSWTILTCAAPEAEKTADEEAAEAAAAAEAAEGEGGEAAAEGEEKAEGDKKPEGGGAAS